jgi:glycine betaine catabolism B
VATLSMLPFVLVGGFLIIRKIRRWDLVYSFLAAAVGVILVNTVTHGSNLISVIKQTVVDSPIFFFAAIMLTEPLTTPPTAMLQAIYGAIVGFLFSPQIHFGSFYTTPEIALLFGNVFSYIVSPKTKLIISLKDKIKISPDVYDFIFGLNRKLAYRPGQYMEWTLPHQNPDDRGNRRYFTLASSPTENNLRLGIKFNQNSSSFKKTLLDMNGDHKIVAAQIAGDFTLPANPKQKLVFVAGGIGVTPFRSMVKYLIDTNQKRQVTVFYANRNASDIVYQDIFDQANRNLGIKTVYVLSDKNNIPAGWTGKVGHIDAKMITEEVPDWRERTFYISGPHALVTAFEQTLAQLDIPEKQIKTDYFPGFA